MNFKYYFPTLVLTGIFILSSCGHHNDPSAPDGSSPLLISRPDSAYIYSIDADSVESLVQLTYFTYDANGNMTLEFDSVIAPQFPYSASKSKIEMQYDEKGNIIVEQISSYSPRSESWENGQRNVYEYDAKNKLSVETIYLGYSGPLENPSKKICFSWIDDTHASCLGYMYGWTASKTDPWGLSEEIEYTYNSNGKVEKAISYYVSGDSTAEKHLRCTSIYEYDQYGNLTLFTFSDQNNVVQLYEYNKYEYDAKGKMLIKWRGKGDSKEENRKYTEKYVYFY